MAAVLAGGEIRGYNNHMTNTERHPIWPHLPAGPWKFTGFTVETYQACPGAPIQVGGSCDHCATGISNTFHFVATKTGERFRVGSTCVEKMFAQMKKDHGERNIPNSLRAARDAARKERNRKARERANVRRQETRNEAMAMLATRYQHAARLPHPKPFRADKGDTMADWAEWMMHNGGEPAACQVITALKALA